MEPEPIMECGSCGTTWNVTVNGDDCPECGEYRDIDQIAEETFVRAKFIYITAEPDDIDGMIDALKEERERLEELRDEGWELQNPGVSDDYAYLRRPVK